MIRRIRLKNYMSHVDSVFELADGLTVLTGPNNCGKSAVVSALQTVCRNESGDYMVRHGAKEASVTVETDDGHVITWRRKGKTVNYEIDGAPHHRLGRGTPDGLHALLKLPLVQSDEDGTETFDVHFGSQKQPIFLLDKSDRKAAVFFASSSDAARLMQMQKRHKEKVQLAKRDRERVSGEVARLQTQLESLRPLDELSDQVETVMHQHGDLTRRAERFRQLTGDRHRLDEALRQRVRIETELAALEPLQPPPELHETRPLEQHVQARCDAESRFSAATDRAAALTLLREPPVLYETVLLESLCRRLPEAETTTRHLADQVTTLQPLIAPPDLADEQSLERLLAALREQAGTVDRAAGLIDAVSGIQPPPELRDTSAADRLLRELRRGTSDVQRCSELCATLERLSEPSEPRDPQPLSELLVQLSAATDGIRRLEAEVRQHDESLEAAARDLRELVRRSPVCPTCGAELDPERLLTREHDHAG